MDYYVVVTKGSYPTSLAAQKLVGYGGVTDEEVEALSAAPVYVSYVELLTALWTGVIDGVIVKGKSDLAKVLSISPSDLSYVAWEAGMIVSPGDDDLTGTADADQIVLLGGNDRFDAKAGDDVVGGGAGHDRIIGGLDNDILSGGAGRDKLIGGQGADTLKGGAGRDRLFGGDGQDILLGGKGKDRLVGGADADTFVFGADFGADVVVDFDATSNHEKIDLSDVDTITDVGDLNLRMTQDGNDVVIDADGGNSIRLLNVDLADLGNGDFIF